MLINLDTLGDDTSALWQSIWATWTRVDMSYKKIHKNVPLQVHTLLFIAAMDMSRHFESDERPPWLTDKKILFFKYSLVIVKEICHIEGHFFAV